MAQLIILIIVALIVGIIIGIVIGVRWTNRAIEKLIGGWFGW